MNNLVHSHLTGQIIKAFYKVYNELGYGFLEKVYENALILELRHSELKVEQQKSISVYYQSCVVGEYFADLIVEETVIIELKANESISEANISQLINYLKATKIEVGLLLNFGQKPDYKRKVFNNQRKSIKGFLLNL
jgi:GxxExxY protein